MPQVFDNIDQKLLPALQKALSISDKADFCVGFFNLRGWRKLDAHIRHWSTTDGMCRLLVGMHKPPRDQLLEVLSLLKQGQRMDNQTAIRLKKKLAEEFRNQLMLGVPNNEDEAGLRQLAKRLKEKKVIAKLFLRHPFFYFSGRDLAAGWARCFLLFGAGFGCRMGGMLFYFSGRDLVAGWAGCFFTFRGGVWLRDGRDYPHF